MTIDDEWEEFCSQPAKKQQPHQQETYNEIHQELGPEPSSLYISTRTIMTFINQEIDLDVFWSVPIIDYYSPIEGVINKQKKIQSYSKDEFEQTMKLIPTNVYTSQYISMHIDNPTARVAFKDKRKISIGLFSKQLLNPFSKKKTAFDNCFILMLRINHAPFIEPICDTPIFKEYHIKVFNTGKIEIPGIQNVDILKYILSKLLEILRQAISPSIHYKTDTFENILLNSDFSCNFDVNREKLSYLLKNKYDIDTTYDPCSYPGTQSKFYYNLLVDAEHQTGSSSHTGQLTATSDIVAITVTVFRTGNVLISGQCRDDMLHTVYRFICNLLKTEYSNISSSTKQQDRKSTNKTKPVKKVKRKYITTVGGRAPLQPPIENGK